ncbi:hypothetical protein ATO6_02315 [Oceanicola sp. 22II-s10i]|uniref:hypothetical protein n=1 Tax=Oceanicola sp. 22II-s10i TaxID=1317116 RepID=UPI000B523435|nr:hypothetical protein [Oceanicola sp. 22II-s10i]OWU85768.1 hypothetical protein ATO6_02315 [Oceanicola sp. 22II-s10i]
MKKLLLAAACLAGFAAPAAAHGNKVYKYTYQTHTIVVSCFRGPWKEVIWDRPNSVFVESLVEVGYDYPSAHAIAERICRDDRLVGNPDGLKSTMEKIFYESPEYRSHFHKNSLHKHVKKY